MDGVHPRTRDCATDSATVQGHPEHSSVRDSRLACFLSSLLYNTLEVIDSSLEHDINLCGIICCRCMQPLGHG